MRRLILDTFKRFFNNISSICIFLVSLAIVFFMLFFIPFIYQKAVIGSINDEISSASSNNAVIESNTAVLLLAIPFLITITFPFYSSCLLIPVFLSNIDQNNTIFILTRKYSRQSLFLAKMIVNAIFTLVFAAFSFLALLVFTRFVPNKYMTDSFTNLFLNIGGMITIFIFTVQIIITTIGFFLQKRAMMYSILIALGFATIFIVIHYLAMHYIQVNDPTTAVPNPNAISNELYYLIIYILIPLGMLIVTGSTSI